MWTLVGQGEVMAYAEPKPVPEKDLDRLNADLEETDKATRVEAALALRIAGASYSEIADVLGYASVSSARLAVERSLASTITEESREEKRRLIARRIERLTRAVWGKATDENHPEHLAAVRTALSLVDRYAKLVGADAPTEVTVYTPTVSEMERWIAEQASKMLSGLPEDAVIEGEVQG